MFPRGLIRVLPRVVGGCGAFILCERSGLHERAACEPWDGLTVASKVGLSPANLSILTAAGFTTPGAVGAVGGGGLFDTTIRDEHSYSFLSQLNAVDATIDQNDLTQLDIFMPYIRGMRAQLSAFEADLYGTAVVAAPPAAQPVASSVTPLTHASVVARDKAFADGKYDALETTLGIKTPLSFRMGNDKMWQLNCDLNRGHLSLPDYSDLARLGSVHGSSQTEQVQLAGSWSMSNKAPTRVIDLTTSAVSLYEFTKWCRALLAVGICEVAPTSAHACVRSNAMSLVPNPKAGQAVLDPATGVQAMDASGAPKVEELMRPAMHHLALSDIMSYEHHALRFARGLTDGIAFSRSHAAILELVNEELEVGSCFGSALAQVFSSTTFAGCMIVVGFSPLSCSCFVSCDSCFPLCCAVNCRSTGSIRAWFGGARSPPHRTRRSQSTMTNRT